MNANIQKAARGDGHADASELRMPTINMDFLALGDTKKEAEENAKLIKDASLDVAADIEGNTIGAIDIAKDLQDGEYLSAGIGIAAAIVPGSIDNKLVKPLQRLLKNKKPGTIVKKNGKTYTLDNHGNPVEVKVGTPPPNMSPRGARRRGAFRQAKRDANIPVSQQPNTVYNSRTKRYEQYNEVPMLGADKKPIKDSNGNIVYTKEYHYTNKDGEDIVIQDHGAGHQFGEGGTGDQGSHFNVRPSENTNTGKVPNTKSHYDFKKRKKK
jgi:hypothetical protein